jgi:hypothetical protein
VFDVLRATSSMVTALSNGAKAIVPVAGIPEALNFRSQKAEVLLAGEREGVRLPIELTGGIAFDLGNSPREFKREIVAGKTIVMTTTNGTRALRVCVSKLRTRRLREAVDFIWPATALNASFRRILSSPTVAPGSKSSRGRRRKVSSSKPSR